MFNLNENNRIVISRYPTDMRVGINGMCGQVRNAGLEPTNGDVYIFVGKSRKIVKLLHWERGGYVVYYKRLEQGRPHPRIFLRQGILSLMKLSSCPACYFHIKDKFQITEVWK